MSDSLELIKQSVGKYVFVMEGLGYFGIIKEVKNAWTFVVEDKTGNLKDVSVYDIRYVDRQT